MYTHSHNNASAMFQGIPTFTNACYFAYVDNNA